MSTITVIGIVTGIVVAIVVLVAVVKADTRFHGTVLVLLGFLVIAFYVAPSLERITLEQIVVTIRKAALCVLVISWGMMLVAKDTQRKVTCFQGIRLADDRQYHLIIYSCLGIIVLTSVYQFLQDAIFYLGK